MAPFASRASSSGSSRRSPNRRRRSCLRPRCLDTHAEWHSALFRPCLEILEDRVYPGDVVLGISALALWGVHDAAAQGRIGSDRSGNDAAWQQGVVPALEDGDLLAATSRMTDSAQDGHAGVGESTVGILPLGPASEDGTFLFPDDVLAQQVSNYRLGLSPLPESQVLHLPMTGMPSSVGVPGSTMSASLLAATAAAHAQVSGHLPSLLVASSSPVSGATLSFDASRGQLAIRTRGGPQTVQEAVTPDGFVDVTLGGLHHSSNPHSGVFDSALAGAIGGTVSGIAFDGGGYDTLTLDSQRLAGGLAVQATGATVVADRMVTAGPLAIQASNITISGAVQGSSVNLEASGWVTVDAAGRIDATPSLRRAGDIHPSNAIDVAATVFVNSGQLHADGATGGQINVQAGNILNAGPITADATGASGKGGQVHIAFTGAYIDTTAATISASSLAGPGGDLAIDGGSTGRLYSSGRQLATGSVGGAVDLSGQEIVLSGATVNASGQASGGVVRIVNAEAITVTSASIIEANALHPGGGGGTLLLDPKNILISAAPVGVFPQFDLIDPHPTAGGGFGTNVSVLDTGNVVVTNPNDDLGGPKAGALYVFDPVTGALRSALVGSEAGDAVGNNGITPLSNGNFLVVNPSWNNGRGAVTWGNGRTGVSGIVSDANSLIGSNSGDQVGSSGVTVLSNGNYLVLSPNWNGGDGAVTWGNGTSGITGAISEANSLVGTGTPGVTLLSNSNYVVCSPSWNNDAGAVTWGSGSTGVRGIVSEENSLVGSNTGYGFGDYVGDGGIIPLSNGNYVVANLVWNRQRGAVTWGDGSVGVHGTVSDENSLVGSNRNDFVGSGNIGGYAVGITPLSDGNYVVASPNWHDQLGAVTWGDGRRGVHGVVSDANSLVGTTSGDQVGGGGVTLLTNGNFVVQSPNWNAARGAVTWENGSSGVTGPVSGGNSLIGSNPLDQVGSGDRVRGGGVVPLSNGNFLVDSPTWNSIGTPYGPSGAGAVTWADGNAGVYGTVTDSNSLVGSVPGDGVGYFIWLVGNSNYVVGSPYWNGGSPRGRGAATWGSGATGVSGFVSEANSLVGTNEYQQVGRDIRLLVNGNYLILSQQGTATWASGDRGVRGVVSETNSLVGAGVAPIVVPLDDGNYLLDCPFWNGSVGAVTWGNGSTGTSGVISEANSLVGSHEYDYVGSFVMPHTPYPASVLPLSNGNYLVVSPNWNGNRGAVTLINGPAGFHGTVSEANSLVGSNSGDFVGGAAFGTPNSRMPSAVGVAILGNGNYVIDSRFWNGGAGAVTWENGTTGASGTVSDANSLVGSSPQDQVGTALVTLANGNYVIASPNWNGQRGALTWGDNSTGVSGIISGANSLVGSNSQDLVGSAVTPLSNGNFVVESPSWNGGAGAATWGNGSAGIKGTVSDANSLVGSNPRDQVGQDLTLLSNGNYVVASLGWNSGRGAVTWGDARRGVSGIVSSANSLVGNNPGDSVGSLTPLSNGNYLVQSPAWKDNRGAVTWVNGTTGQTFDGQGIITPQNSLVGHTANAGLQTVIDGPMQQSFLVPFVTDGGGQVVVGLTDPNQFSYARAEAQGVALTPEFVTATLDTGTAVVLQASNDITIQSPITVSAGGHGGALSLEAGRSIVLNAPITTDNGALTLIANDQLANGVVDSERDPGPAVISMAPGTSLNTGSGNLTVELRDGAGLTHCESSVISLQPVTAGSVWVANDGPSAGSDVQLGPVTSRGSQEYASPHGTTSVMGNLTAADSSIRFHDAVAVNDGVTITAGTNAAFFSGGGTQVLQSGADTQFGNINHTGSGILRLTGGLSTSGSLINQAASFDANDQPVNVAGMAALLDGTYLAGTAPQRYSEGLTIAGGLFTSSSGPMSVSGGITLVGGQLSGVGTVDSLTARGGTVAPGRNGPGVLTITGPATFNPATTLSVALGGTAAGIGYSQLVVGGGIDLGSSTLSLTVGFEPPVGSTFEIVNNSGGAAITGTLAGLPEGAIFSAGGYTFQITYQGGPAGNSVVLTRLA